MSKINTEQILLNSKELLKVLLDWEYPVGKGVKITWDNVNPGTYLGGIWEALPEDYALWTTTTAGQGGKTIAAGLPNHWHYEFANAVVDRGKTTKNHLKEDRYVASVNTGGGGYEATVLGDVAGALPTVGRSSGAAVSNTIYKNNCDTVQPPAIKIFAWKRIG